MDKLEKVIKGLEEVQHYIKVENLPAHTLKAKLVIDDAIALLKAQEPKQIRCEDCGYAFTEGFVHERLVCEKHPDIAISYDWYCADFWKE